jgi:hypothetical protein
VSRASRSCVLQCQASLWSSGLAEAWHYAYTDFGEGRGRSPQPVLRAVVQASTPGTASVWSALVDTGAPITLVRSEVLRSGGDPIDSSGSAIRATQLQSGRRNLRPAMPNQRRPRLKH